MEVASGLNHHRVPVHGLTERTKEHHQLINVHVSVHGSLTIYGHDRNADKQVKRVCVPVCPAGLPDVERVFVGEFPLETDEKPSVREHEREAFFDALKVRVEGGNEELN